MKSSTVILISAALLALAAAGIFYFLGPREASNSSPSPTSSLSPSAANTPSREPAPAAKDVPPALARNGQLTLEIERALVARDPQQRETAFNFLLPELLEAEPERVVTMVARQEPGEARDALRDEVARQWITRDRDAAVAWMKSFENEAESKASATIAVRALAASSPAQAIYVADQFGIGRNDGSLEHMVQIWAAENLDEATRWIEAQPENPHTAQLRARIEEVREQKNAARE